MLYLPLLLDDAINLPNNAPFCILDLSQSHNHISGSSLLVNFLKLLCICFFIMWPIFNLSYAEQDYCVENRYVFDIGSGATKSVGIKFDKCANSVLNVLGQKDIHVKYQDCVNESKNGNISDQCIAEGIKAIEQIKEYYGTDCYHDKCYGVATAWARRIKNRSAILDNFKVHGLNIKVLSQYDEGKIGYEAAINATSFVSNLSPEYVLVLDVGGGSFQISGKDKDMKIAVYHGKYGVFNYANYIRKRLNIHTAYLTQYQYLEAVRITASLLKKDVGHFRWISDKNNNRAAKIIGIGSLLNLGLSKQIGLGPSISKDKLIAAISEFTGHNIEWTGKRFPRLPKEVAYNIQIAMILIYSIMDTFNIKEIYTIDASIASYIATTQEHKDEHDQT